MNRPAKITPLAYSTRRARVWPHLIDYNLHLNNAKYMTILERGRWQLFRDNAWFKPLLEKRINLVIASTEITYIRELPLMMAFDIQSRIQTWDDKYLYVEQKIVVKGKLFSHALFKLAAVSKGKRMMPDELCKVLNINVDSAEQLEQIKHWRNMTDAKKHGR